MEGDFPFPDLHSLSEEEKTDETVDCDLVDALTKIDMLAPLGKEEKRDGVIINLKRSMTS